LVVTTRRKIAGRMNSVEDCWWLSSHKDIFASI